MDGRGWARPRPGSNRGRKDLPGMFLGHGSVWQRVLFFGLGRFLWQPNSSPDGCGAFPAANIPNTYNSFPAIPLGDVPEVSETVWRAVPYTGPENATFIPSP